MLLLLIISEIIISACHWLFLTGVPGPQRASEAGLLLSELLVLVNQAPGSNVATITVEAITDWLSTRDCSSVVIPGLLRVLTTTVQDEIALGTLMEATLTAFFRRRGMYYERFKIFVLVTCFVFELYQI